MSYLKTLILTAAAGLFGVPASAAIDYLHLYLVGQATPARWDANLPEEMVAIGGDCFLWDGYLDEGDFKFINVAGDFSTSFVATEYNKEIGDGGKFDIVYNGDNKHYDHKFYVSTPGYARIVVDMRKCKVTIHRAALLIVGDGALGWGDFKKAIPVFADDNGVIEWSGLLRQGEIKFLKGESWFPCYCAYGESEELSDGNHGIFLREKAEDGDYKYRVPRDGRYTLKFFNPGQYDLDVTSDKGPELWGAFHSREGRYVVAVDRDSRRLHFGKVPDRLVIGTGAGSYQELQLVDESTKTFSSSVRLNRGEYYKLCYDPSNWSNSLYCPNYDVDITRSTTNVAPMDGYSYTVPQTGDYQLTASFNGTTPTLGAYFTTGVDAAVGSTARVTVADRTIIVEGDYTQTGVYDVAGHLISQESRTTVAPGIYIVKVDARVTKIMVK